MANSANAEKRHRQNERSRLRNRFHRGRMRTSIKAFHAALDAGDQEAATLALKAATSLINKTRSRGVIHKNTASRKVGRLVVAFNRTFKGDEAAAS